MAKLNNTLKWAFIIGGLGVTGVVGYFVYQKIKKIKANKLSADTNSLPPTPFKNKEEGNLFRAWVNDTYPDYAKEIDLWREGEYDNSYIRKAYQKYGKEYEKQK